ncbi:MAG: 4Fe-4S binding protein [Alkalispirochaeta sp.]
MATLQQGASLYTGKASAGTEEASDRSFRAEQSRIRLRILGDRPYHDRSPLGRQASVTDVDECILCGACEIACPLGIVLVTDHLETDVSECIFLLCMRERAPERIQKDQQRRSVASHGVACRTPFRATGIGIISAFGVTGIHYESYTRRALHPSVSGDRPDASVPGRSVDRFFMRTAFCSDILRTWKA